MNATPAAPVFILPTSGSRTYRGKYPTRPRGISAGDIGLHLELNDGTRLWTAKAAELPTLTSDCSALLARAVPMSAAQYATLREAAELLATRANFAGRGPRADITARARAMVSAIGTEAEPEPFPTVAHAIAARARTEAGELPPLFDESVSVDALAARPVSPAEREAAADVETISESPARLFLRGTREALSAKADSENPATVALQSVRTIDVTPTWAAILPLIRAGLERGTPTGRRIAWEELERMATAADAGNRFNGPSLALASAARAILAENTPGTRCALRVALDDLDRTADAGNAAAKAARTYPDCAHGPAARAHGVQSFDCGLERSANPFEPGSEAAEQWESGYAHAASQWRAARREAVLLWSASEAGDAV